VPPVPRVPPLVPFPAGLSAKALALADRLDTNLRYPGAASHRVASFLRYQTVCRGVVKRYRALIQEVTPKLAERRTAVRGTLPALASIGAADRTAFWGWLGRVRIWLEDELTEQSHALVKSAATFRKRCPRQAAEVARHSQLIDKIQFRARIDLHDLFALSGAPAEPRSLLPAEHLSAPPLVPLPGGLSAKTRARCRQFSAGLRAFFTNLNTFNDLFKGPGACKTAVSRLVELERTSLSRWIALDREQARLYFALLRSPARDRPKVKRWYGKLCRRVGPRMKRVGLTILRTFKRFHRRCPGGLRRLAGRGYRYNRSIGAARSGLVETLTSSSKRGWTFSCGWSDG
jgi:hypothetical protein